MRFTFYLILFSKRVCHQFPQYQSKMSALQCWFEAHQCVMCCLACVKNNIVPIYILSLFPDYYNLKYKMTLGACTSHASISYYSPISA